MHYQMRSCMWKHFDQMRSCMWEHFVNQNFICMLICVVDFFLTKAEDGETGRPMSSCSSVKCAPACWIFTPRFHLPPSFRDTVCLGQSRAICFKENKPVVKALSVLELEDRGYPEILQTGQPRTTLRDVPCDGDSGTTKD